MRRRSVAVSGPLKRLADTLPTAADERGTSPMPPYPTIYRSFAEQVRQRPDKPLFQLPAGARSAIATRPTPCTGSPPGCWPTASSRGTASPCRCPNRPRPSRSTWRPCRSAVSSCRSTLPTPARRCGTSSATRSRECSSAGPSGRPTTPMPRTGWSSRPSANPGTEPCSATTTATRCVRGRGRRSGRHPVHLRYHRALEGRGTHPRQPGHELRSATGGLAVHRRRPVDSRAADLPHSRPVRRGEHDAGGRRLHVLPAKVRHRGDPRSVAGGNGIDGGAHLLHPARQERTAHPGTLRGDAALRLRVRAVAGQRPRDLRGRAPATPFSSATA